MSNKNVTQKEISEVLKMSRGGFNKMLRNKDMKISTLQSIADHLKLPITYFFEEKTTDFDKTVDMIFDTIKEEVKIKIKKKYE